MIFVFVRVEFFKEVIIIYVFLKNALFIYTPIVKMVEGVLVKISVLVHLILP